MNIKSKNSGDKVKRHKNEYLLMNKDIVIGKVHIENNEMDILGIKDIKSIVNIKSWLHDRVGIMQRQNIIDLAKMAQISNLEEFINITNMVSVTDAVWMKRADTNITWRQVSPYQNTISAVMANIALDGLGDSNKCGVINFKSPSPQYRLEGTADKCVKRVGNSLRIYKSCGERLSDGSGLRPYCEYFAYKLMKK